MVETHTHIVRPAYGDVAGEAVVLGKCKCGEKDF